MPVLRLSMPQSLACGRPLLFALLLFGLAACSASESVRPGALQEVLELAPAQYGERPLIESSAEIHWLSEEQKKHFHEYYHDPRRAGQSPERRMVRYLDLLLPGFEYSDRTLTVSGAIAANAGNCLTLAIVVASLAQLAELEVGFQLMEDQPIFAFSENTIQKGVHVRSRVMNPSWSASDAARFISPGITVDYFSSRRERFIRNLSPDEYLALYYRNIAIERLEQDLGAAYWYVREALKFAPADSASLNLLAVISRRAGDAAVAEEIYRYAIDHAHEKLSLLKNYRVLLVTEGRLGDARRIERQLRNMEDPSPFNWYHLAQSAAEDGDHRGALAYYQRALAIAPYLHEAHLGIARSWLALGDAASAREALRTAINTTGRISTQRLYKAKLATFSDEPRPLN